VFKALLICWVYGKIPDPLIYKLADIWIW